MVITSWRYINYLLKNITTTKFVTEDISEDEEQIKTFINTNVTAETRVVLTGACTSNHVKESLVYEFIKMLSCGLDKIRYSPKSVCAYELPNNIRDIKQLVITCIGDGESVKRAKTLKNRFVVLMPKEFNDKGSFERIN